MKRITGYFALAAALVPLLLSCEMVSVITMESRVVNAASGDFATGVSGVTVTLSGAGGVYRTRSDSTGYWYFDSVPSGTYTATAERYGWFFAPQEIVVRPWNGSSPVIRGVPLSPADEYGISFMLTWDESVRDLDLHLTAPTFDLSYSGDSFDYPDAATALNWADGFGPATNVNRVRVDHRVRSYPSAFNPSLYLLRDHTGYGGAEVITLRRFPFTAAPGSTSRPVFPTYANGLATLFPGSSALTFRWMGVVELYASRLPRYPLDAAVTIHVFQTVAGGSAARYLGAYLPPATAPSGTASIIRVNLFLDSQGYEVFQLVADQAAIYPGTPGILSGDVTAAIGVRGLGPEVQE